MKWKKYFIGEAISDAIMFGIGYDHKERGICIMFGLWIPWILRPTAFAIGIKFKPEKHVESNTGTGAKKSVAQQPR